MKSNNNICLVLDDTKMVLSPVIHNKHLMYKGVATDGYQNIFFTDVETGKWVEEDLGFTAYAAVVGNYIDQQNFRTKHFPKAISWRNILKKGKPVLFGFAYFVHGEERVYEIYHANRKYMYSLIQHHGDDWELMGAKNIQDITAIDTDFLMAVTAHLAQSSEQENN